MFKCLRQSATISTQCRVQHIVSRISLRSLLTSPQYSCLHPASSRHNLVSEWATLRTRTQTVWFCNQLCAKSILAFDPGLWRSWIAHGPPKSSSPCIYGTPLGRRNPALQCQTIYLHSSPLLDTSSPGIGWNSKNIQAGSFLLSHPKLWKLILGGRGKQSNSQSVRPWT